MKKNILYAIILGIGILTQVACSSNNSNPSVAVPPGIYPYGAATTAGYPYGYGSTGYGYGYDGMVTMQCLGTFYSYSYGVMQPISCMGQCRGYMMYNQMGQQVYCQ